MFSEALSTQRRAIQIPFRITITAGTPSLTEGGTVLDVVDGGVGVYNITFGGSRSLGASKRIPVVNVTALNVSGTGLIANVIAATLAVTGFTIEVSDDAGTLADAVQVHGTIIWFDSADEQ